MYMETLLSKEWIKNYIINAVKKNGEKIILQVNAHIIKEQQKVLKSELKELSLILLNKKKLLKQLSAKKNNTVRSLIFHRMASFLKMRMEL